MRVRKFRLFRLKYGISCEEIAYFCGVSAQRISQIELQEGNISQAAIGRLTEGLGKAIRQRQLNCEELSRDYARHRDTLFELVKETEHEL